MKKIIKIFICLLFIVTLSSCGCGKKVSNKLIQISGYDAYEFVGDKKSFILVLLDSKNDAYPKLITDLNEALSATSSNIYYVDLALSDAMQYEMLNATFGSDGYAIQIICIQHGNIVISQQEAYDYDTIVSIVKGKKYPSLDLRKKDAEKKGYYEKGQAAFAKGLISEAYHFYALSIPYEDASTLVNGPDFYLINNWVSQKEEAAELTYLNIAFSGDSNTMYRRYYKGSTADFNIDSLEIKTYDYYVKDQTIYVYDKATKEYIKMYTIDEITTDNLKVHTKKTTYQFKAS